MIVVVGQPRSGTSERMQMLRSMGLTVRGAYLPPGFSIENHPGGVWECPETVTGIFHKIEEDCVKMMIKSLLRSSILPTKLIVCKRDFTDMTKSQMRSGLLNWGNEETGVLGNKIKYNKLFEWVKNVKLPFIEVEHNDFLNDYDKEFETMKRFVLG